MRWKNPRPVNNEAYQPTNVEHLANIATHGLCIPLVWSWVRAMYARAATPREHHAAVVYGCVLMGLFTVSTIFHVLSWRRRDHNDGGGGGRRSCGCLPFMREVFHRGDRAMIYLFIAGSYTPWLALKAYPAGAVATEYLEAAVWGFAAIGILYQQVFHERYKWLETTFYVLIATLPSYAVLEMEDEAGVAELRAGGAAYLIGVIFFKLDGVLPLAHAVWHLHVVAGALTHLHAVTYHLFGENANS